MTRESSLAYCAGYFDGEGSISIKSDGSNLTVRVVSKDKESIELLVATLGGKLESRRVKWKGNQMPGFWMWTCYTKTAQKALQVLIPYLVAKKAKAIDACNLVIGERGELLTVAKQKQRLDFVQKWQSPQ